MDYCPMQWKYADGEEQDSHVKFFRGVEESARLSGTTNEQILKQIIALAYESLLNPGLTAYEKSKKQYQQSRRIALQKKKVRDDPWDKPMYRRNHE